MNKPRQFLQRRNPRGRLGVFIYFFIHLLRHIFGVYYDPRDSLHVFIALLSVGGLVYAHVHTHTMHMHQKTHPGWLLYS